MGARGVNVQRGAAAVEMAIVLFFLLVLVTGIIDVGRLIFNNISIQEAAQEGAFYGAFEENVTVTQIKQRVVDSTSSPAIDPDEVSVTCTTQTRSKKDGSTIRVTVEHDLDLITPFVGTWFGGTFRLGKTAEAERFHSSCPS